jgi:hypothetical protein
VNLYLVYQTSGSEWDQIDMAAVLADNSEQAIELVALRRLHPQAQDRECLVGDVDGASYVADLVDLDVAGIVAADTRWG